MLKMCSVVTTDTATFHQPIKSSVCYLYWIIYIVRQNCTLYAERGNRNRIRPEKQIYCALLMQLGKLYWELERRISFGPGWRGIHEVLRKRLMCFVYEFINKIIAQNTIYRGSRLPPPRARGTNSAFSASSCTSDKSTSAKRQCVQSLQFGVQQSASVPPYNFKYFPVQTSSKRRQSTRTNRNSVIVCVRIAR